MPQFYDKIEQTHKSGQTEKHQVTALKMDFMQGTVLAVSPYQANDEYYDKKNNECYLAPAKHAANIGNSAGGPAIACDKCEKILNFAAA